MDNFKKKICNSLSESLSNNNMVNNFEENFKNINFSELQNMTRMELANIKKKILKIDNIKIKPRHKLKSHDFYVNQRSLFILNNEGYKKLYNLLDKQLVLKQIVDDIYDIKFKEHFNLTIDKDFFSYFINLTCIEFSDSFNQSLNNMLDNCPEITTIKFGKSFNKPLNKSFYNLQKLKMLEFGDDFNQVLDESLYENHNLIKLQFGKHYDQDLGRALIQNKKLFYLDLGQNFNQPLFISLAWAEQLQFLKLSDNFDFPLNTAINRLFNLRSLHFGNKYNQDIHYRCFSRLEKLIEIKFGDSFNQDLFNYLQDCKKLQIINFGKSFNQPIHEIFKSFLDLRLLIFGEAFSQNIYNIISHLHTMGKILYIDLHKSYQYKNNKEYLKIKDDYELFKKIRFYDNNE